MITQQDLDRSISTFLRCPLFLPFGLELLNREIKFISDPNFTAAISKNNILYIGNINPDINPSTINFIL
jgi:hypothetical protein